MKQKRLKLCIPQTATDRSLCFSKSINKNFFHNFFFEVKFCTNNLKRRKKPLQGTRIQQTTNERCWCFDVLALTIHIVCSRFFFCLSSSILTLIRISFFFLLKSCFAPPPTHSQTHTPHMKRAHTHICEMFDVKHRRPYMHEWMIKIHIKHFAFALVLVSRRTSVVAVVVLFSSIRFLFHILIYESCMPLTTDRTINGGHTVDVLWRNFKSNL